MLDPLGPSLPICVRVEENLRMSIFSYSLIFFLTSWNSWESWLALHNWEVSHLSCVPGEVSYMWKLLEYVVLETILIPL